MSIEKPEIDFPGGEPPKDLDIKDIWEGDGEVAKPGDFVKVHYVGVSFDSGEEFDASWNRGAPLDFRLGRRPGHPGLGPGCPGHEGRRPSPADHPRGPRLRRPRRRMGKIAPGETLIFVCDLVGVAKH